MKVSGNGFDFNAAQSLLPVGPSGSSGLKSSDARQVDQADAQDFGSLLSRGPSDSDAPSRSTGMRSKDTASVRVVRSSKGAVTQGSAKGLGLKQGTESLAKGASSSEVPSKPADALSSQPQPAPDTLSELPAATGSNSDAQSQGAGDSLLSTASELPLDPRLVDPSELAMEAAAIAALVSLSPGAGPVSVEAQSPTDSGASDLSFDCSGGGAGSSSSYLSQMALRTLQASPISAPGSVQVLPVSSAQVDLSAKTQATDSQSGNSLASEVTEDAIPAMTQASSSEVAVQSQVSSVANPLAGLFSKMAVDANSKSQPTALPISSQLISLAASPSEVAALVAASAEKAKAALSASSQKESLAVAGSAEVFADVRSAVSPAASVLVGDEAGAENVIGRQRAAVAGQELNSGSLKSGDASGVSSELIQASASGGGPVVALKGEGQSASDADRGNDPSDSRKDEQGNLSKAGPIQKAKLPQSDLQSGTLGASNDGVPSEETNVRVRVAPESLPASGDDASQSSPVVERAEASSSATGASFGAGARSHAEVVSKPTMLPPVQSRAGEVWKVIQEAVQRARSENPSHLAVEVRMDDGSTLGVELRMSSAGLQASFRSESQSLLRSIEAQWSAFVSKEPADARVTSAVFESRSGFGGSTESGTSGGERRQQMEDASAAASLGRFGQGGSADPASASGGATSQVHVQKGRISAYA